jgi:hypothetical protein
LRRASFLAAPNHQHTKKRLGKKIKKKQKNLKKKKLELVFGSFW